MTIWSRWIGDLKGLIRLSLMIGSWVALQVFFWARFWKSSYECVHGGRSHYRRRDRRLQHRLASYGSRLQKRAGYRARERPGQRLHGQEHGRSARAILDACEHTDVALFHSLLR